MYIHTYKHVLVTDMTTENWDVSLKTGHLVDLLLEQVLIILLKRNKCFLQCRADFLKKKIERSKNTVSFESLYKRV